LAVKDNPVLRRDIVFVAATSDKNVQAMNAR
jgi:hypothetical protein